jgi:hypothetical protein
VIAIADIMAEIQYLDEDYPRVMTIKSHRKAGMLPLREFLERLAGTEASAIDLLSDLPAVIHLSGMPWGTSFSMVY